MFHSDIICSICDEEIVESDNFLTGTDGEWYHRHCLSGITQLFVKPAPQIEKRKPFWQQISDKRRDPLDYGVLQWAPEWITEVNQLIHAGLEPNEAIKEVRLRRSIQTPERAIQDES